MWLLVDNAALPVFSVDVWPIDSSLAGESLVKRLPSET
jgi:hypothetical protein